MRDRGVSILRELRSASALEHGCGLLLVLMTVVCFFQVVGRYLLLTQAIGWAEEVSRLCFVWGVFVGAVIAVRTDSHLGVDLFVDRLAPGGRLRAAVVLFKHVCMLVVAAVLLYYGYHFARSMAGDRLTTLGYSRNVFYLPAPVSGFLMVLWLLPRVWRDLRLLVGARPTT